MPTIIVEDGTGVASANSFIDTAYLSTYASDRGLSVSSSQQTQEQHILLAMDYLSYFAERWEGAKSADDNALDWPRTGASIGSVAIAKDAIPEDLKKAQAQLVVEKNSGVLLFPAPVQAVDEGIVIQKTVGPLTKKYSFTTDRTANPNAPIRIAAVWAYLRKLLTSTNHSTVRV